MPVLPRQLTDALDEECEKVGASYIAAHGGKHIKVTLYTPHGKRLVVVGKTISDYRGVKNVIADVRRALRASV
jgi:hypothetical protein